MIYNSQNQSDMLNLFSVKNILYMCVYIYIQLHIHVCIYTHMHTHTFTHKPTPSEEIQRFMLYFSLYVITVLFQMMVLMN